MNPLELLQLIRTTNAHQVLLQLEQWQKKRPLVYECVVKFYQQATEQPKKP